MFATAICFPSTPLCNGFSALLFGSSGFTTVGSPMSCAVVPRYQIWRYIRVKLRSVGPPSQWNGWVVSACRGTAWPLSCSVPPLVQFQALVCLNLGWGIPSGGRKHSSQPYVYGLDEAGVKLLSEVRVPAEARCDVGSCGAGSREGAFLQTLDRKR